MSNDSVTDDPLLWLAVKHTSKNSAFYAFFLLQFYTICVACIVPLKKGWEISNINLPETVAGCHPNALTKIPLFSKTTCTHFY